MILLCNHKRTAYEKLHAYSEPMCASEHCQWCGEPYFAGAPTRKEPPPRINYIRWLGPVSHLGAVKMKNLCFCRESNISFPARSLANIAIILHLSTSLRSLLPPTSRQKTYPV
jgi:hypothetical protein